MHITAVLLVAWTVNGALNLFGAFTRSGRLDRPLDGKVVLSDGRRLLGASTTWGGLALCLAASLALSFDGMLALVPLLVYVGHALGSFIKRRLGYADGKFLPGIDHGDYALVIGVVFVSVNYLTITDALLIYMLSIAVTPLVTLIAHSAKLREHSL